MEAEVQDGAKQPQEGTGQSDSAEEVVEGQEPEDSGAEECWQHSTGAHSPLVF